MAAASKKQILMISKTLASSSTTYLKKKCFALRHTHYYCAVYESRCRDARGAVGRPQDTQKKKCHHTCACVLVVCLLFSVGHYFLLCGVPAVLLELPGPGLEDW